MTRTNAHNESLLEQVVTLQDGLLSLATGGSFGDDEYRDLRRQLIDHPAISELLPAFIRRCRDLGQFWQFIKHEYATYKERREFLWESFRPLVDELEALDRSPAAIPIGVALEAFDPGQVHLIWQKAYWAYRQRP